MSIPEHIIEKSEKIYKELKAERDSIKVQLHLLNMDAKEEWGELEKKYKKFKVKASTVADVTEESAGEVLEAVKLVGEELSEGYRRIRDSL